MYKSLVFGDEFLAQGLHLKSHQRCSAGIRTWLSADQSSSSTLTESSFPFDSCLIHRDTKKTFIFSSSVLLLCVHTQYNPFAHPSCLYYYLLSPIYCFCTSYLFLHILFLHILLVFAHLVFAHLTCFCTSYLFLHILLVLHILFCTFLYSITHFTLYFYFLPIYMLLCGVTFI